MQLSSPSSPRTPRESPPNRDSAYTQTKKAPAPSQAARLPTLVITTASEYQRIQAHHIVAAPCPATVNCKPRYSLRAHFQRSLRNASAPSFCGACSSGLSEWPLGSGKPCVPKFATRFEPHVVVTREHTLVSVRCYSTARTSTLSEKRTTKFAGDMSADLTEHIALMTASATSLRTAAVRQAFGSQAIWTKGMLMFGAGCGDLDDGGQHATCLFSYCGAQASLSSSYNSYRHQSRHTISDYAKHSIRCDRIA